MEEMTYKKSYQEYKAELDGELQRTAEGFVRIGFLLKVARDTNILAESGYKTVAEFAQAEYSIDKTQVSRFISINDKFSENGYSDALQEQYKGFGYAKLAIMLQLPDAINEGLSPEYTKSEIQQIKNEIDDEKNISDLQVMMETRKMPGGSLIKRVVEEIGKDDPKLFVEIAEIIKKEGAGELPFSKIMDAMAPDEEKTYSVRVPAEGKIMLMLSTSSCRMVNTRSGEKTETDWQEIKEEWVKLITDTDNPKKCWSEMYCMVYPEEKEKVAPVQQKKESKVQTKKAEKPKKIESKPKNETNTAENETDTEENETDEAEKVEQYEAAGEGSDERESESNIESEDEAAGEEYSGDIEEKTVEVEAKVLIDKNAIRGYKAGITSSITKLKALWDGDGDGKIEQMLKIADDLKWRLEQLKESEEK